MKCPVDMSNCCDDLCYGGGCLKGGGDMLEFCQLCKQWHSPDDEFDLCTYDDYEYPESSERAVEITGEKR